MICINTQADLDEAKTIIVGKIKLAMAATSEEAAMMLSAALDQSSVLN